MARIAAAGAVFAFLIAGLVTGPGAQGLVTMPKLSAPLANVTYGVGGVTISAGGTPVGGIGVSGAPGGQLDEECARAAIAKIQDRMKYGRSA